MIRVSDTYDPLLNRPFSICYADSSHNTIAVVYQVVGKGTLMLSREKPGDSLAISHPLGRGFPVRQSERTMPILLGGGIGIAPLLSIFSTNRSFAEKARVFWGIRGKADFFDFKMVDESLSGLPLSLSSEDGTIGEKGTVLELFLARVHDIRDLNVAPIVYACGPTEMLRPLSRICHDQKIELYVSLETRMACGTGYCLGCSVPSSEGKYLRTCREGPVFNAASLSWEQIHECH